MFFPASWRQWKRKLYSNLRARLHKFNEDFIHRMKTVEGYRTNAHDRKALQSRGVKLNLDSDEDKSFKMTSNAKDYRVAPEVRLQ